MRNGIFSSPPSPLTPATDRSNLSESRAGSIYFPGCRKDMNCHCQICLASIEATLDLKQSSTQRSSLTKISHFSPETEISPRSSSLWIPPTPEKSHGKTSESPLQSSTNSKRISNLENKKNHPCYVIRSCYWRCFLSLSTILVIELSSPLAVSRVLRPVLSSEIVKQFGQESASLGSLEERLGFLQRRFGDIFRGQVSNCSSDASIWQLHMEGSLLYSSCALYKSKAEEVSIWGSPLQIAGLFATGFSARSFTVISGRITEWQEGKPKFLVHEANTSQAYGKWVTSLHQLDADTWVLEYRQSIISQNPRLILAIFEALTCGRSCRRIHVQLKKCLWMSDEHKEVLQYPT